MSAEKKSYTDKMKELSLKAAGVALVIFGALWLLGAITR